MYREQFQILEDLLRSSQIQQIWSIYSLCNHNSKFENFEICKDILKLFVNYISEEKKDLQGVELVYLVMGDASSNEVTYKLVYDSDLSSNEFKVYESNIYGLISRRNHENSQENSNFKSNSLQFHVECDDIYKSIKAKNSLSDKLWNSKFSNIANTESNLSRESNNVNFNSVNLDQLEVKSKTEPYPILFNNNKSVNQNHKININKNENEQEDQWKKNDYLMESENNTDPYPMKNVFDNEKKVILQELNSKQDSDTSVNDNITNLFKDEEDENANSVDQIVQNEDSKCKPTKRRKTSKPKGCNDNDDNENKIDFDPLQVEPIVHSKVKKEKMYKDAKTGYLVVEDDVDFVMEKENKNTKSREKVFQESEILSKRANKTKKSQTFNNNSGTSKQQTLNSFFKIVKSTNKNN
ncbi:hypothetical protein CmeUKMEL1_17620 [Cryptosporidium meleagridis]|uniref:DNA polymerase delta subunit 3 n=1 Tax=Cryptosporidium meleagridis TaxID=93969 RepID=A0A2P4Z5Y6_9CRYT|nr:hypothetical protein CmeUKMEL1_17620 [Cryptosporidium meleagridis]